MHAIKIIKEHHLNFKHVHVINIQIHNIWEYK